MVKHAAMDYLERLDFLKCSIAFWTGSGYVIYHLEQDEARKVFGLVKEMKAEKEAALPAVR